MGDGCRAVGPGRLRRGVVWAFTLSVAASLPACGLLHRSSTPSAADLSFLSEVHDGAPGIGQLRSDSQLIGLAHAVCSDFSAGASYQEVADRLSLEVGGSSLPTEDLGAVITAATDDLCPQFRSRV